MTAFLFVLVPVALFALIAASCFVGCGGLLGLDDKVFDGGGPPEQPPTQFNKYADEIINTLSCVAFWPLNDSKDPTKDHTTAVDAGGKAKGNEHDGTYRNNDTDPTLFPYPMFSVPGATSAVPAVVLQTIGAPGIVMGDKVLDQDSAPLNTAMFVDGGVVEVGPNDVVNLSKFTVEFWARPEWDTNGATRVVIDSRDIQQSARFGFAVWVNDAGNWTAELETGLTNTPVSITGPAAVLNQATYVALTCDGNNAQLFVDGSPSSPLTPVANFMPNTTKRLVIGAGVGWALDRPMMPEPAFPLFPFKGTIQDVAIYGIVLDAITIMNHSQHGQGNATG